MHGSMIGTIGGMPPRICRFWQAINGRTSCDGRGKMPTGRPADKVKDAGPVTAEALFAWLDEHVRGDDWQRPALL